jgi:hypothetical protein
MISLLKTLKRLIRRPFEMHKDLKISCAECGNTFRFEAGEQAFYKSRGLSIPKRCPDCRSRFKRQDGGRSGRRRR